MSGLMYGVESDQLDQLAISLEASADELQSLLVESAGEVALATLGTSMMTIWRGPRASDFANLWRARHLLKLNGLEQMLRDAARTARANSDEQRNASNNLGVVVSPAMRALVRAAAEATVMPDGADLWPRGSAGWHAEQRAYEMRDSMKELVGVVGLIDESYHLVEDFATVHASSMGLYNVRAGLFGAALEGTYAMSVGIQHGVGSSEFAQASVEGAISAAVGFVPGGGVAYYVGSQVGEQIYQHTPVGDLMLNAHAATAHVNEAEFAMSDSSAAVAAGDFERAARANERAAEQARLANEQSQGWTGMWNATKSLVGC